MSTPTLTDREIALLQALQRQFTNGYIVDTPTLQLIRVHVSLESGDIRKELNLTREALRAVMDRLSWHRSDDGAEHKDDYDAIRLATAVFAANP